MNFISVSAPQCHNGKNGPFEKMALKCIIVFETSLCCGAQYLGRYGAESVTLSPNVGVDGGESQKVHMLTESAVIGFN